MAEIMLVGISGNEQASDLHQTCQVWDQKKANKVVLIQGYLFIPCPQGQGRTTPRPFISPSINITDLPVGGTCKFL
jgi:hypothetical protein